MFTKNNQQKQTEPLTAEAAFIPRNSGFFFSIPTDPTTTEDVYRMMFIVNTIAIIWFLGIVWIAVCAPYKSGTILDYALLNSSRKYRLDHSSG